MENRGGWEREKSYLLTFPFNLKNKQKSPSWASSIFRFQRSVDYYVTPEKDILLVLLGIEGEMDDGRVKSIQCDRKKKSDSTLKSRGGKNVNNS